MSDPIETPASSDSSSTAVAETPASETAATPPAGLKLNMLCGQHPVPGYINVDSYGEPDQKVDLESFPWPWADNSVEAMRFHFTLQQLGQTQAQFNKIVQEIYRVCRKDAMIEINVPHPMHEDFFTDPLNIRAILPGTLAMYSKALNRQWKEQLVRNRPLGLYLNVDFEIARVNMTLEEPYFTQLNRGQISRDQVLVAARQLGHVVKSIEMMWRVVKD